MNLSTQFQIEHLVRIVDECNDIDALKEQTKQLIRLYFVQRDTATTLLLQKV
jgi:hypothetical protein